MRPGSATSGRQPIRESRPDLSREVDTYLNDPQVQEDPRLRLRALVARAALDRNSNELTARHSWERILKLAKELDDKDWENRAEAEIGQVLYMEGDLRSATDMLREAITSQYLRLDLGAAIYYTAMVGNGFVSAGRPETGLRYCNAALRVAAVTRGAGFPFLAYQGKARALIALNRKDEAAELLEQAIARARQDRNFFALTQLLIVAGTAIAPDDPAKGLSHLSEAVELSQKKGFHHVFAWSTFELATAYRDSGNLDAAEQLATRSNRIMRELEDRYHLPQHLALLADLKARKGDVQRADELYSEATDVIEGLLVKVNQRQLKSSLIETLSDAYVGHFELAATAFSDPAKAYEIVERARGRVLADTLRGERETLTAAGGQTAEARKEITRIQSALLRETDRDERAQLLDKLFRAEQLLSPVRRTDSALSPGGDRSKPVPLATIENSLSPDEILLEYVLGKEQSYCLKITRTGAAIITLPTGRERIDELVDEYLDDVRSRKADIPAERTLFSILLQPVLDGDSKARLIVVPDGKLNLLPFDALRDEEGKYVLESHVVTYAPSATVLHLLRTFRSPERPTRSFLGVGNVVYSGDTPRHCSTRGITDGRPRRRIRQPGIPPEPARKRRRSRQHRRHRPGRQPTATRPIGNRICIQG